MISVIPQKYVNGFWYAQDTFSKTAVRQLSKPPTFSVPKGLFDRPCLQNTLHETFLSQTRYFVELLTNICDIVMDMPLNIVTKDRDHDLRLPQILSVDFRLCSATGAAMKS